MLTNFPIAGSAGEFSMYLTDSPFRFVLYERSLPSRLDSLLPRSDSMRHVSVFLAASLLLSLFCLAQDGSTRSVHGMVVDPSGGRIFGASIALANNATGFHYQQTSDTEGRFAFGL